MKPIKKLCLIGGGSQTHVIAGLLAHEGWEISILTRRPEKWAASLTINLPDKRISGRLAAVSSEPGEVIPDADIVLLTVPGYANEAELKAIKPFLSPGCFVGGVFCSSGFFFEALKLLPDNVVLWGFQRVPFIARVNDYGHEATIKGFRPEFKIAVERASDADKESFRKWIEDNLGSKTTLLNNYLEASITNSNPILHTARLYTMFSDWNDACKCTENIPFYETWTLEAAQLLMDMDRELFEIIGKLPVSPGYLQPLLEYYESTDAESLKNKISSIPAFRSIMAPMVPTDDGWKPDYSSRYFTEDFGYSLRYIWELGHHNGVEIPNIDKVYLWGRSVLARQK